MSQPQGNAITMAFEHQDQQSVDGPLVRARAWTRALTFRLLNYHLPENSSIHMRLGWPLVLLPISLINQLLAPHPVWVVLLIVITGLYGIGIFWVRHQQKFLSLNRARDGEIVAAGDPLTERFELRNDGVIPVLWATVEDGSNLPGYNPSRVVASSGGTGYKWQTDARCGQRGIFQLGPTTVRWGDPFGLFMAQKHFPNFEQIVIYPRIAQIPEYHLPYGSLGGARQLHQPLIGSIRSASVRQYQPGDTLRHVHWPATARHRNLMVTELDAEHGGEVWIVIDLNSAAQQGEGENDTLEYSIVVAASLAAQLINSNERLSVGLLMASGKELLGRPLDPINAQPNGGHRSAPSSGDHALPQGILAIAPQSGQAQFWEIMGALAMARAAPISLAQILQGSRTMITSRQSMIVITPQLDPNSSLNFASFDNSDGAAPIDVRINTRLDGNDNESSHAESSSSDLDVTNTAPNEVSDWLNELVQSKLRRRNSVILIQYIDQLNADEQEIDPADETITDTQLESAQLAATQLALTSEIAEERRLLLSHHEIGCLIMRTDDYLTPIVTQTRVRREIRVTPMGGAVTVEVEEEVT